MTYAKTGRWNCTLMRDGASLWEAWTVTYMTSPLGADGVVY